MYLCTALCKFIIAEWIQVRFLKIKLYTDECLLWQYGLWSFQTGGTKLEKFLPKNQYTQKGNCGILRIGIGAVENWTSF